MDHLHTLLLTPWMAPHRIVNWQTAITLLVGGKINVLEEYDEAVVSPRVSYQLPAVAQLKRALHGFKRGLKFSRINILTRDGFQCQYCGTRKPMRDLNYDHVVPRAQGGKTEWENIVASCYPCNSRKAHRTPAQAGMTLLKRPVRPKTLPMTSPIWSVDRVPELWRPYLDAQSSNWATGGALQLVSA